MKASTIYVLSFLMSHPDINIEYEAMKQTNDII